MGYSTALGKELVDVRQAGVLRGTDILRQHPRAEPRLAWRGRPRRHRRLERRRQRRDRFERGRVERCCRRRRRG